MGKRVAISILVFFISTVPIASGFGAGPVRSNSPKAVAVAPVRTSKGAGTARKTPLRDGFVLTGVDGKLTSTDSNDIWFQDSNEGCRRWFFEFDSDISVIKAGTSLELLPSSTLEKMTADVEKHSGASYKLWGRVTKYKGRNFIFPIYFLPLGKTKRPPPSTLQE